MAKTTCDRTVEQLPWWLNGSLGEAEAETVARHLEECPGCADELAATHEAMALYAAHLSIDTLLDRVEDPEAADYRTPGGATLSPQTVEGHLSHCASCREELSMLRASRAALTADPAVPAAEVTAFIGRDARRRSRGRGFDRRSLALAASLVLFAVTAGGWFLTGRLAEDRGQRVVELERRLAEASAAPVDSSDGPAASGPIGDELSSELAAVEAAAQRLAERVAELESEAEAARQVEPARLAQAIAVGPTFSWQLAEPVLRGGDGALDDARPVPAGAEEVSLFVEGVGEGPFRLEIEDGSGRRLATRDGLRPYDHPLLGRHLTVTLPVTGLPRGLLRLRLLEGGDEIGSLALRVDD